MCCGMQETRENQHRTKMLLVTEVSFSPYPWGREVGRKRKETAGIGPDQFLQSPILRLAH